MEDGTVDTSEHDQAEQQIPDDVKLARGSRRLSREPCAHFSWRTKVDREVQNHQGDRS